MIVSVLFYFLLKIVFRKQLSVILGYVYPCKVVY